MNAAANPAVVIAGLTAWIHSHSNDSVTAQPGCQIFDSKFGGNAVRVEYKYSATPGDREAGCYEDVALECFWHAGRAFDLEEVSSEQVKKWQLAAFAHAVEQGERESLSIAITNLEAA